MTINDPGTETDWAAIFEDRSKLAMSAGGDLVDGSSNAYCGGAQSPYQIPLSSKCRVGFEQIQY